MAGRLTLILGGARSGKSRHAAALAAEAGGDVLFVATAEPGDQEMQARISQHRASRPNGWRTLEAPTEVGAAIRGAGDPDVLILDCLTLLASNAFGAEAVEDRAARRHAALRLEHEIDELLRARGQSTSRWIVVSNEVGWGVVPATPLGRAYRDALGRANERVAEAADEVILMVAGQPLSVKEKPAAE